MAFTIYGPGIRDEVKLDNLFEKKSIEQLDHIAALRKLEKDKEDSAAESTRRKVSEVYAQRAIEEENIIPVIEARQLMSAPVLALTADTTLKQAREFFQLHRFRHAPVVNRDLVIEGIVSDRDVLTALVDNVEHPANDVREIEVKKVLTTTPDRSVRDIARIFFEQRIGAMPIVEDHKVVGIITRGDVLRVLIYDHHLDRWS